MSIPSTKITKTITIKPGEQFVIPNGANVTTIIGTVSSDGCVLPAATQLQCYLMLWETTTGELNDAYYDKLIIGDLEFNLSNIPMGGVDGISYLYSALVNLNSPFIIPKCSRFEEITRGNWVSKYLFPKSSVPPKVRIKNPASSALDNNIFVEFVEDNNCETCI